ncbi:CD209 antigen-like protein [Labeo rohita]|uniref:CD209 antigen-like protein n=1 Tax=Labeo rohita TaxID=84645 RepID=A0A498NVU9_LABRO|nr:CD209 antigen-like protein [Labeo rohita]
MIRSSAYWRTQTVEGRLPDPRRVFPTRSRDSVPGGSRCLVLMTVSLGLICVLLLVFIIQQKITITAERDLIKSYKNTVKEFNKTIKSLQNNYTDLMIEKHQLQNNFSSLKKTLKKLELETRVTSLSCFFMSTELKNWSDSRQYCRDRGADLVIIKSEEKQRFISSLTTERVWIGLSDTEQEGNMKWVDNSTLQKGFALFKNTVDIIKITALLCTHTVLYCCFFMSTELKSWSDSRQHCRDRGADLVIIKSEEKQVSFCWVFISNESWSDSRQYSRDHGAGLVIMNSEEKQQNITITAERDLIKSYKNTVKEFNKTINSLQNEKQQLQNNLNSLSQKKLQLEISVNNLTAEKDELQINFTALSQEKLELESTIKSLNDELKKEDFKNRNLCGPVCYFISTELKSWSDSRQYCRDRGADLVIINSEEKQHITITAERDLIKSYKNTVEEFNQTNSLQDEKHQLQNNFSSLKKLELETRVTSLSWFFMSNELKSWSDSRQYCRDRGADLIIINTEEKQRFISSLTKERVWIGLSDTEQEGNMTWVDNSTLKNGDIENTTGPQTQSHGQDEGKELKRRGSRCLVLITGSLGLICVLLLVFIILQHITITAERDLMKSYKNTVEEFNQTINSLQDEKHQLQNNFNSLSQKKLELEARVTSLSEELKKKTSKRGWFFVSNELKSWSDSRQYCRDRGADLVIINSEVKQHITVEEFNQTINSLQDNYTDLMNEKHQLQNNFSSLSQKKLELESKVTSLSLEVNMNASEKEGCRSLALITVSLGLICVLLLVFIILQHITITAERDLIKSYKNTVEEFNQTINSLQDSYTDLMTEKDQLQDNFNSLIQKKLERETRVNNLTDEKGQLQRDFDSLSLKKLELESRVTSLSNELRKKAFKRGYLWGPDGLFMSNELKSWSDSRQYCRDRGADLVIINSEEKQRHISSFIKETVWIGLSDEKQEGSMKWVDDSPLNEGFWAEGEPNNRENRDEDCIELIPSSSALNNWRKQMFGVDHSWFFMSNKKNSWSDSRQYCRDRGADLVIINSEEKQRFMSSFTTERVWIGLSDTEQEGNMKWVDNSSLKQGFWLEGEPNDLNGTEDCNELNPANPVLNNWNDLPCSFTIQGICEK